MAVGVWANVGREPGVMRILVWCFPEYLTGWVFDHRLFHLYTCGGQVGGSPLSSALLCDFGSNIACRTELV